LAGDSEITVPCRAFLSTCPIAKLAGDSEITVCACERADVIPAAVKGEVFSRLERSGASVTVVPDLCGLAGRADPLCRQIAAGADIRIAACHPRAVRWLFHAAGAELPAEGVTIADMRSDAADVVVASLTGDAAGTDPSDPSAPAGVAGAAGRMRQIAQSDPWTPWFPVIDYERCINCKTCLGFCLFGVYSLDRDGKVVVSNPDKCKTNCPAPSRGDYLPQV